jgi:hypothetical protein
MRLGCLQLNNNAPHQKPIAELVIQSKKRHKISKLKRLQGMLSHLSINATKTTLVTLTVKNKKIKISCSELIQLEILFFLITDQRSDLKKNLNLF